MAVGDEVQVRRERADGPVGRRVRDAYFEEIGERYPGFDPARQPSATADELAPPDGTFLVAYLADEPVGCAALKRLDGESGEIRRMWVSAPARGRGLGRRLLQEIETAARDIGYRRVRLTVGDRQPEALALYRSAGFVEVDDYDCNPYASFWLEKELAGD